MKKLANTSPFLLLLIPVFVMMILTFITTGPNTQNDEMASKSPASKGTYIKVVNPFSK